MTWTLGVRTNYYDLLLAWDSIDYMYAALTNNLEVLYNEGC